MKSYLKGLYARNSCRFGMPGAWTTCDTRGIALGALSPVGDLVSSWLWQDGGVRLLLFIDPRRARWWFTDSRTSIVVLTFPDPPGDFPESEAQQGQKDLCSPDISIQGKGQGQPCLFPSRAWTLLARLRDTSTWKTPLYFILTQHVPHRNLSSFLFWHNIFITVIQHVNRVDQKKTKIK